MKNDEKKKGGTVPLMAVLIGLLLVVPMVGASNMLERNSVPLQRFQEIQLFEDLDNGQPMLLDTNYFPEQDVQVLEYENDIG